MWLLSSAPPLTAGDGVTRLCIWRSFEAGDVAVLTFNLVSYRTDDGVERAISKWNSTEVYRRTAEGWRIWHSHWSYIRPDLEDAVTELL